ncbi:MAG TPA: hypothetical protein DCS28_00725 [Candidatus Moranbacteria bacterium]|nr:hypothetical protein [Candidatus Moranbacteria bacterium]HAT74552.1 hypothetical protein [Candidatus Moranbacteria bacterium]
MDLSHLDKKYFIDTRIYNCPFCRRGNVVYRIIDSFIFDWSNESKVFGYLVKCGSNGCEKISLHFSKKELRKTTRSEYGLTLMNEFKDNIDLDNEFFYSRPTSFFTIDERINKKIRDLVFEAEQSRQANLLVGGSACLRKVIYELLEFEKSILRDKKTGHANYQESIRNLKNKFPKK